MQTSGQKLVSSNILIIPLDQSSIIMGNSFEAKKKILEFKHKIRNSAIMEVDEENFED